MILRRFTTGGASSPSLAAEAGVGVGADEDSPAVLGFLLTITPLSAFLTDTSFLGTGMDTLAWSSPPGLDGADDFETVGGGLLIAFSLAATALGAKLT